MEGETGEIKLKYLILMLQLLLMKGYHAWKHSFKARWEICGEVFDRRGATPAVSVEESASH